MAEILKLVISNPDAVVLLITNIIALFVEPPKKGRKK